MTQSTNQPAEQLLQEVKTKTGETVTPEQLEAIREAGLKAAEKNKGKSVEQQDIIGAKEYQKAEEKLREGDIIGSMKLQAYAALGAYGPAKRNAAITKFGSGILASNCTGWAGFLLKVANSSGLTDRLIQNFTGSEEADKIVDAQGQGAQVAASTTNVNVTAKPSQNQPASNSSHGLRATLAQAGHAIEHVNTPGMVLPTGHTYS